MEVGSSESEGRLGLIIFDVFYSSGIWNTVFPQLVCQLLLTHQGYGPREVTFPDRGSHPCVPQIPVCLYDDACQHILIS